ncbi:pyruvate formate lyase family protein [Bacteroides fragilis]|uniref:pyruvate formate lyase family protein n=1 Tax=Bacteroides fragilis TaxID=817 RepID=UPI00189C59E3|nr:pyruvate formate lyase family protein [Bacteroides fragilis]
MNERINYLKTYILDKRHHSQRRTPSSIGLDKLNTIYAQQGLSPVERATACFAALMNAELPVILPGEKIVFTRTLTQVPDIYTPEEWNEIKNKYYVHEKGTVCNISPNYAYTIQHGLEARKQEIRKRQENPSLNEKERVFLNSMYQCIISIQKLIEKYEQYALLNNETKIAHTLHTIKTEGAQNFRQALQLLRILHFSIWEAGNYHNTLGRFDQYMYPFYQRDLENGTLTKEEAFDLLEEFFLVCNKDSDLYPGMQQGDNGQSLVLGGRDPEGKYLFNDLSRMCLQASYELKLIDPKINIRVDPKTPDEIFTLGSRLTKIGLGFPQYSNDDIIIPGLIRKGYSKEDAYNYVVAACWEFIIPNRAMDIPNIDAVSLIGCVDRCLEKLNTCSNYSSFYTLVEQEIQKEVNAICEKHRNLYIIPSPMMSLLMDGTIERAKDISEGSYYNNYGIHGTGIATATDTLAALKKYYFEEQSLDYTTLLTAIRSNFKGYEELQKKLREEAPKMGQDNDYADLIAKDLLDSFDRSLADKRNERGGVYRAGTGTAMYYIFHSNQLRATPDGRNDGEMIPANYSPSLFLKQKGPISVIKSFTKQHLDRVVNGGPLTLEFDQTVFSNDETIEKLGMLVKTYIVLGGHQLQLNTVSRETLLHARKHPEQHKNLIVRVWGWSGYFVELDECYQNHVINRIEFGL